MSENSQNRLIKYVETKESVKGLYLMHWLVVALGGFFTSPFTRRRCGLCSFQLSLFLAFLLLVYGGVGPTFATVTQPRLLIRRPMVISSIQAAQL